MDPNDNPKWKMHRFRIDCLVAVDETFEDKDFHSNTLKPGRLRCLSELSYSSFRLDILFIEQRIEESFLVDSTIYDLLADVEVS